VPPATSARYCIFRRPIPSSAIVIRSRGHSVGQRAQRQNQIVAVVDVRHQPAGDGARRLHRARAALDDAPRIAGESRCRLPGANLEAPCQQRDRSEFLAECIVHVAADPLLLTRGRIQQALAMAGFAVAQPLFHGIAFGEQGANDQRHGRRRHAERPDP